MNPRNQEKDNSSSTDERKHLIASTPIQQDLIDMHTKFGLSIPTNSTDLVKFLIFRLKFSVEEVMETVEALYEGDSDKLIDGLIDQVVVAVGTLDLFGVDFQESWRRVMDSNMSKVKGNNSSRSGSSGIDLVKPEGWKAPTHFGNEGNFPSALNLMISQRSLKSMEEEFNLIKFEQFHNSIPVFIECMNILIGKSKDYNSARPQADYQRRGIETLFDEVWKKVLRIESVMNNLKNGVAPSNESLRDSFLDAINYLSFCVTYIDGKMNGQDKSKDMFNRPLLLKEK